MKRFVAAVAVVVAAPLTAGSLARAAYNPAAKLAVNLDPLFDEGTSGRYIVLFGEGVVTEARLGGVTVPQLAAQLAALHDGTILYVYEHALQGFAARLTPSAARHLSSDPLVGLVEEDQPVQADATQSAPTWGLDRMDERERPLDGSYAYDQDGSGVHAYVVDSGIRATHNEFTGRIGNGKDFVSDGRGTSDCHGHGTHVAGTLGGTTYGVAKRVALHPVRVLGCDGSGLSSDTAAGVDWVMANHVKPAVANMSIRSTSSAVAAAVKNSISAGIVYSISAGNESSGTCDPERVGNKVPEALIVGSTTSSDARSSFSNYGSCVDLFAPGSSVVSAGTSSDSSTATKSGTSMATPHVTGVTALYLDEFGNRSPQAVHAAIVDSATNGALTGIGSGSPNRLAHSLFAPAFSPAAQPVTVFFDDFEIDRGWKVNPDGTDAATTGAWERGNPEGTASSYGPKQLGTTVSGVNDLVTGRLAGADSGANDVDGGETSVRSPAITLPASGTIALSFSYYMAHGTNSSSSDYLRVSVLNAGNGASTRLFSGVGGTEDDHAAWTSRTYSLDAFVGQRIHVLIRAADQSGASLVEAAFDDVQIVHDNP